MTGRTAGEVGASAKPLDTQIMSVAAYNKNEETSRAAGQAGAPGRRGVARRAAPGESVKTCGKAAPTAPVS